MSQQKIFDEITAERANQDAEWGGPRHDDQHSLDDWCRYIDKQTTEAENAGETDLAGARERFVKVAALAVAAIESIDRQLA